MSYYVGFPLIFLVAMLEASVLPLFRVADLQPDLVLVLMVSWLMVRGPNEAFVLIPFGGLMLGLVDGAPMGTALLALAPLAFLQEARGARLSERGLLLTIFFTVLMTLSYHTVYMIVFTLRGEAGSLIEAVTRVFVPSAVLNVAILLPIYAVMSFFSQELRRATYV